MRKPEGVRMILNSGERVAVSPAQITRERRRVWHVWLDLDPRDVAGIEVDKLPGRTSLAVTFPERGWDDWKPAT